MPGLAVVSKSAIESEHIILGSGSFYVSSENSTSKTLLRNPNCNDNQATYPTQIVIKIIPEIANALRSIREGESDLFFGMYKGAITPNLIGNNSVVTPTQSLMYNHFFLNAENEPLNELAFSEDLSSIIRTAISTYHPHHELQTPLDALLPKEILGDKNHTVIYRNDIDSSSFKNRWRNTCKTSIIRIKTREGSISKQLADHLLASLRRVDVHAVF